MIYPKNPYCPMNNSDCPPSDGNSNDNMGGNGNNTGNTNDANLDKNKMLKRIMELEFTLTDLNLYLDTHPDNKEALDMFTKIAAMLKSLMYDYSQKYEPLCASDVKNILPFQWVKTPWPWQM